ATMRPLNEDGTWQYKTEKEYLCVRNGEERGFTAAEFKNGQPEGWEKQYQYKVGKKKEYMTVAEGESRGLERASKYPKSTKYGRQNPISERWNSEEQLVAWRAAWADIVNRALERKGVEERVDHRSHAERGLDEQPTIHEGVTVRQMEQAGFVSERCELNRQIRADNALIRELKALIAQLMQAVRMTLTEIARAMEQARQDIIVFTYGLLHNREQRNLDMTFIDTSAPKYHDYVDASRAITEKAKQRKALKAELAARSPFDLRRRRELKASIAALEVEIDALHTDRESIIQAFKKTDDAGMSAIAADIKAARVRLERYDSSDDNLTERIGKAKAEFDGLKKQAEEYDRDELTDARLAFRPQMEDAAHDRIKWTVKGGKVSFWNYLGSITDTDELLGEAGMAERRREQRQREALAQKQREYPQRKRKGRDIGR
ncbi:MAG: MobA/MobL family protein, partial [Oscillospiraceae bacterium]|nr:MobA/MobL family protein [Oscillospiraceae bacterium]